MTSVWYVKVNSCAIPTSAPNNPLLDTEHRVAGVGGGTFPFPSPFVGTLGGVDVGLSGSLGGIATGLGVNSSDGRGRVGKLLSGDGAKAGDAVGPEGCDGDGTLG